MCVLHEYWRQDLHISLLNPIASALTSVLIIYCLLLFIFTCSCHVAPRQQHNEMLSWFISKNNQFFFIFSTNTPELSLNTKTPFRKTTFVIDFDRYSLVVCWGNEYSFCFWKIMEWFNLHFST
jgi:hypothetical protein